MNSHHHNHHAENYKKRLSVSLALTVPILLLSEDIQMLFGLHMMNIPYRREFLSLFSIAIYLYGGWPFLTGLLHEIRAKKPGMMTLVGSAITIALFYSLGSLYIIRGRDFLWELATLIDIMLLGHWIEAKSVVGASRAIEELIRIMPITAHLIKDSEIIDVSVKALKKGDLVLVRPGEKIPSDGVVVEGESFVNEAFLTGESTPVLKRPGELVVGGSLNGDGVLKVRVEKTGDETYLAQVIKLVKEIQETKSRTQNIADRAAALLFYIALSVAILTFTVWSVKAGTGFALERAVTVMVIACPHALGLAIPLVVAISSSLSARNGILVRDRDAFEKIKDVDVVVFDKTGTITEGNFEVEEILPFIQKEELLYLTASVEVNSEHIAAKAIVEYAKKIGVSLGSVSDFRTIPGRGAYGIVDGRKVYVGGWGILDELNIELDRAKIQISNTSGKTLVFSIVDGSLAGVFFLAEKIREGSREAVKRLKEMGIDVYLLTGDSVEAAERIAHELDIEHYFARVLPTDKAEKIRYLREKGLKVAMVGDGINDAPALMAADVGIAIGAGTDIAIESADIILVKNDPRDVVKAIEISRKSYSKMVQNLWWATGYNMVAIPIGAGALIKYGIYLPVSAAALMMSLSTIIVAFNSQSLRKFIPIEVKMMDETHIVKDPVCGMEITPDTAYSKIEHEGRTVYFCSKSCETLFRKNPKKYIR